MTILCTWCQQPIAGKYLQYEDGDLCCQRCRDRLPSCQRCGKPTPEQLVWTVGRDKIALCAICSENASRCFACGVPLLASYYSREGAPDRNFCERCMQHRDHCDFCGMPLGEGATVYSDGRMSCRDCRTTAVIDQIELDRLDRDARRWYRERFGLKLRSPQECPARLADAATIARLQNKVFQATPGFDARERGLFHAAVEETVCGSRVVARKESLTVWVESGLPRDEAFGTLVHELAHLWQFDAFRSVRADPRIVEGTACWFQYHALKDHGADAAAQRVAGSVDPVYGGGFRKIKSLEDRHGIGGTIAALMANAP